MSQVIDRAQLTDLMLATLRAGDYPIGDAGPPELPAVGVRHAGWNGQPNTPGSFYVPYAMLTPQTISNTSGPFGDPQADAQVPYTLAVYGIDRRQVETLAGRLRALLLGLRNTVFTAPTGDHKIQQVWFTAVGGVGRVEASEPPTFAEVDTISVWTTK